jgi:hypothetical protein
MRGTIGYLAQLSHSNYLVTFSLTNSSVMDL